jgi:glutathione S-transferase
MKLYYNPRSRATISKWVLDECGADYELVLVDFEKKENKAPEYLAVNPSGKLPALVDGPNRIFESVAIALYLGDKYPQAGLAPTIDSPDRGRYLSLMVYATSQLEPAMGESLMKSENPETQKAKGWTNFEIVQEVIEKELGAGPYLFGEKFTLADILIGSAFIWRRFFGPCEESPTLKAYIDLLQARPHAVKMG